jgi:hypothetical protein
MRIVTLGDQQDGGRVLPLDTAVLDDLQVDSHQFNVNGGQDEGDFSPLVPVEVEELPDYYLGLGACEEDLPAFKESRVFDDLSSYSGPDDKVLVQWAEFSTEQPHILIMPSDGSIEIEEGEQAGYEITLPRPPELPVAITVQPAVNADEIDLGNGPGNPITLNFPAGQVGPVPVTITAVEDDEHERSELGAVSLIVETEDFNYEDAIAPAITFAMWDNDLAGWGYLDGDINQDGYVDFTDVAMLADSWAGCTDPQGAQCAPVDAKPPVPVPGAWIPGTGGLFAKAWFWCNGECNPIGKCPGWPGRLRCAPKTGRCDPKDPKCDCHVFGHPKGVKIRGRWKHVWSNKKGDFVPNANWVYQCWCAKQ